MSNSVLEVLEAEEARLEKQLTGIRAAIQAYLEVETAPEGKTKKKKRIDLSGDTAAARVFATVCSFRGAFTALDVERSMPEMPTGTIASSIFHLCQQKTVLHTGWQDRPGEKRLKLYNLPERVVVSPELNGHG